MIKHLKRFVAITISMVMAFQFCTNDFYLYAETEPADPGQTEVTSESESEPSDSTGEAAEETPSSDTGTPEPSAPVEEQPAAPVEEQPAAPVEEQPEVASILKVEFVDANNASVKETVEQALESKYVGKTINLDELGIDINVEGYTLTEVKDKNDNTQAYTTETKDFVLTGNVTELQFVYTQNVQTDQPEDSQEPSTPQGGQENQEDVQTVEEKAKDLANTVITMARLLQQNSHETIKVSIKGVSEEEDFDLPVGVIADHAPSFTNYTYEYATLGEDGPRVVAVGVYKIGDQTFEYYSTDGQSAQLIGENSVVLHYSKNALDIEYIVSSDQAGTITGPNSAQEGSNVSFVVKPALGYRTTDVKVNGDSIYVDAQEVYTFEMPDKPVKVEATFAAADSYTVTLNPLGNSADYNYHDYGYECHTETEVSVSNGGTLDTNIYVDEGLAIGDLPLKYVTINGQRVSVDDGGNASATVDDMQVTIYKDYHRHNGLRRYFYNIKITNVRQDINLGYFIKDEYGVDERTVQIDELDDGVELYVMREGSEQLERVYKNDAFTLGYDGEQIYFYAKAENGYQVRSFEGTGFETFSSIYSNLDAPGATEALIYGCQWEFHFTKFWGDDPNRTLVIRTSPIEYTVSYDANGGTPEPTDNKKYTVTNNQITLAKAPEQEGFVFTGWALNGKTYDAEEVITIDTDFLNGADDNNNFTFVAQWKAET